MSEACPWCSGTELRPKYIGSWGGHAMYIAICQTEGCGAAGPPRSSEAEAIAAWNRRAPDYAAGAKAMREAAVAYHTMLAEASGGPDRKGEANAYATVRRLRSEYHQVDAAAIRALLMAGEGE